MAPGPECVHQTWGPSPPTSISTERAASYNMNLSGDGLSVSVSPTDSDLPSGGLRAPAGILFLGPAVLLALFFPRRPFWLYFLSLHLVLGALELGAVALGVGWADWGFVVQRFLHVYVLKGVSLGSLSWCSFLGRAHRTPGDRRHLLRQTRGTGVGAATTPHSALVDEDRVERSQSPALRNPERRATRQSPSESPRRSASFLFEVLTTPPSPHSGDRLPTISWSLPPTTRPPAPRCHSVPETPRRHA